VNHVATLGLSLVLLASPLASQTPAGAKTTPKAGAPSKGSKMITTPSGLQYVDHAEGAGPSPSKGQTCTMHYTGWLSDGGKPGKKFDSSVDRGQPFSFTLGVGQVIKGWDEGVASMKKGGKRTLHIPAALGYGARGAGGVIPPNADLIFDVELIDFK
jgi:peptidylprolyl isomerase